jgi:hypothetical protein
MNSDFKVANKPITWSYMPMYEKIGHYKTKLHQGYARYVDKLEAKQIVTEVCGINLHVAPVRRILASPSDFQESDISSDCLLKATHGSGWNLDLEKVTDVSTIRSKLGEWNVPYRSHDEPHYSFVRPRFFIEEKINDSIIGKTAHAPVYMIRCIHGNPVTVNIKIGTEQVGYDTDWNRLPLRIKSSLQIQKPACLAQMLHFARQLSQPFEFVRIDFYIGKDDTVYFSEFTFTPTGGNRLFSMDIEQLYGKMWK